MTDAKQLNANIDALADSLFRGQMRRTYEQTDRAFANLMILQWILGAVMATLVAPRAWMSPNGQPPLHVWLALFIGGVVTLAPILLTLAFPGRVVTRHVVALAQMAWSGILVHLSGGRIESHFHVFGSLAFLAFYRDWRVLTTAFAFVAADHWLRQAYWPRSVFGVDSVESLRWLEHQVWVLFEFGLLAVLCNSGVRQIREVCDQQARLSVTNQNIEALVRRRTDELEFLNGNLLREIQERREAQSKSKELTDELMRTSRAAGMAEVATGVLHNVGNVLNSISVAVSTLQERIRTSRLAGLGKCADLLAGEPQAVSEFLASERGRKLPAYISQLNEQLGEDHQLIQDELRHLRKHVDHITEIIAMQQNYARTGGVTDLVDMDELIDDALKITNVSLLKHEIDLRREMDRGMPSVRGDKHKLLQILVNLIGNAKHAVSAIAEKTDRAIDVVAKAHADTVVIEVRDNGVGIAPENLDKIFNHGFTTKSDGHGYGLHSSALAAKEMGGSLVVRSDGLGQGATFRLEVPLDQIAVAAT